VRDLHVFQPLCRRCLGLRLGHAAALPSARRRCLRLGLVARCALYVKTCTRQGQKTLRRVSETDHALRLVDRGGDNLSVAALSLVHRLVAVGLFFERGLTIRNVSPVCRRRCTGSGHNKKRRTCSGFSTSWLDS